MQGGRYQSCQQVQSLRAGGGQGLDRPGAEESEIHPPSWVRQILRGWGDDQAEVENAVGAPVENPRYDPKTRITPAAAWPQYGSVAPGTPPREDTGSAPHTAGRLLLLNEMGISSPRRGHPGDSLCRGR